MESLLQASWEVTLIRKDFALQPPLDSYAIYLEKFLNDVSRTALKSVSGAYVGDGTTSKTVFVGFAPILLIISQNVRLGVDALPVAKNMVFSLYSNIGVSYIPGTGFVGDAVTGYSNGNITLGVNNNVNESGKNYLFLAIG
jgi:hypothetical protein